MEASSWPVRGAVPSTVMVSCTAPTLSAEIHLCRLQIRHLDVEADHGAESVFAHGDFVGAGFERAHSVVARGGGLGDTAETALLVDDRDGGFGNGGIAKGPGQRPWM